MHHTYALVFTCVFVIIWIPSQILLHKHRHNNLIRSRGYFFLFIQNIGLLISATSTGLYAGLQQDFNCYAYFFLSFTAFPLFCLPFFLRVWEYCVHFHMSAVRAKLSVSDFEVSERKRSPSSPTNFPNPEADSSGVIDLTKTSWFYRNKWVTSRKFLLKYFLVMSWVLMLPFALIIGINHKSDPLFFEEGEGCHACRGIYEVMSIYIFAFGITAILLIVLLRRARDTFHIKVDMLVVTISWMVSGCIYIIYLFTSTRHAYTLIPHSFVLLVGFFFCLFGAMVYPLILVYKNTTCTKRVLHSSPSFSHLQIDSPIEDLINSLQLPLYRNAFHKFLALQFCAESLLFYETAINWKNSFASYSSNKTKLQAQAIYNHFLTEDGICSVNVAQESVRLVEKKLAAGDITQDLFEEPLKDTINLMFSNSYYPFLKSSLYPKTKDVSFSALV